MNLQQVVGKDVVFGLFFASACLIGILHIINRTEELSSTLISTHRSGIEFSGGDEISAF